MKKIHWIATIVAVVIIVAGVAIYYYITPKEEEERSVLRLATAAGISVLDPHNYLGTPDLIVTHQIYDCLTKYDMSMTPQPALATSWEVVEPTTWRFELRQDVKFHDGTPFNASVVKYNYERVLDPERVTGGGRAYIEFAIESVEVEDTYTVLIHTQGPIPYLISTVAEDAIAMISPSAIEKYGEEYISYNPVGTGPYKFVEWVINEYVKLEKNEDYWGYEPTLDEIIFKIIPEESARYMAFLANEIDVISNVPPEYVEDVKANVNVELYMKPDLRMVWFGNNMQKPPFDDIRVRRAIAYAIHRDDLIEYVLGGLGAPAGAIAPPGVWGRLPDEEYGPGGRYPYDPEKAKELLTEAGWIDVDGDGIREKNGVNLEFSIMATEGRYLKDKEVATAISEMLRVVGMKANVEIWEVAAFFKAITAHEYDTYELGFGWGADIEPICRWLFYCGEDGVATWTAFGDPYNADEFFDKGGVELDPEKRLEYYLEAQRMIMDSAVAYPIYYTIDLSFN